MQFRTVMSPAVAAAIVLTLAVSAWGQGGSASDDAALKASQQDMTWFHDAKFGLFICWGPVTLTGKEIGWSRGGERRAFSGTGTTPVEEYDSLYKRFNPTKFDAKQWMSLAKSAGVRYIIFLTKHHDGFCMFDTKQSDYNIMNSPFRRDITGEIAKACHKEGLKLGIYFSAPDWHDADFYTKTQDRFLDRFRGELRELCTKCPFRRNRTVVSELSEHSFRSNRTLCRSGATLVFYMLSWSPKMVKSARI